MILPERVLGRSSVKTMLFGRAMGPIFSATQLRSSLISASSPTIAGPQGHEGGDRLAGHLVATADHGGLGHRGVGHQGRLHLGGARCGARTRS